MTRPEEILAAMKGFESAEAYLCGPGPFMTLVERTLVDAGMPRERVLLERFEASGNDAVPPPPQEEGDVIPSEITIHYENKAHKVPYKKGQTILEAARAAGLNPLSSCEEGFCASCAAKTHQGQGRARQERHLYDRRSRQQLDPDLPGPLLRRRGRDHLRRGVSRPLRRPDRSEAKWRDLFMSTPMA